MNDAGPSLDLDRVASWLADHLPGRPAPTAARLLAVGWESEIYAVDLDETVVVRLYFGAGAGPTARREFAALQALHAAGYPVPAPLAVEPGTAPLGRSFLVMEWVEDLGGWPWSELDDPANMAEFAGLLHRLHTVDWRPFAAPGATGGAPGVENALAGWRAIMAEHPVAGLAPVASRLASGRASLAAIPPAVAHLDFHPGNVLRTPSGPVVVDWTNVVVTDPRLDVAWSQLLLATATPQYQPGRGLVAAYERLAGPLPDMDWFEAAALLRRFYTILASLRYGAERLGMRTGAEELMRAQVPTLSGPYARLTDLTGLRVPEVERLLGDG